MRDKKFIAEHRGGFLKREQHNQLIKWACGCTEHVLHLFGEKTDVRLLYALHVANNWRQGKATVRDASKASINAIALANEISNPTAIAVARSAGHAVATAHMADHALGAALYALKAVKNSGHPIDAEKIWQNKQLPSEIFELVLTSRSKRESLIFYNRKLKVIGK